MPFAGLSKDLGDTSSPSAESGHSHMQREPEGTSLPSIRVISPREREKFSTTASIRKPPRLPGTTGGSRGFNVSQSTPSLPSLSVSQSTPSLPSLPRQGEALMTAAERDARSLGERLRRAIRNKDLPGVQSLLAAHADIEQRDRDGSNATSLAMLQGTPHNILRTLLEARANVHMVDGQGRSLAHLWAWTLPRTSKGMREADKKLVLLSRSKADLNAQLPVTGDAPLHILARVYNTLMSRAYEGSLSERGDAIVAQKDALQFAVCTQSRIQMLVGAGASTTVKNGEGKKPLSLISAHHQQKLLVALVRNNTCTGADGGTTNGGSLATKGQKGCITILDENEMYDDCLE